MRLICGTRSCKVIVSVWVSSSLEMGQSGETEIPSILSWVSYAGLLCWVVACIWVCNSAVPCQGLVLFVTSTACDSPHVTPLELGICCHVCDLSAPKYSIILSFWNHNCPQGRTEEDNEDAVSLNSLGVPFRHSSVNFRSTLAFEPVS